MAKESREALLRRGAALLQEWQIGADADVAALRTAVGRDTAADLAVAARLGDVAGDASVAALQEMERSASDKLVRKEAKRSLYRLAQRGVAIPEEPSAPQLVLDEAPSIDGKLSAIDGNGDQVVWLTRAGNNGVVNIFAIVHESAGLKDLELIETSRKGLRALRADMEAQHGLRLVDADWRYCDFLIDRAFRLTRERGGKVGDYPGMRARLSREPVRECTAPIRDLLDAEAIRQDAAALARSADLLREPELRAWIFPADRLRTYIETSLEAIDSPIVVTDEQRSERLREIEERAITELFDGAARSDWASRLETLAYVFHATGRIEQAQSAFAAALALEQSDAGGRGVPVLDTLVRTCLTAYLAIAQAQRRQEREEAREPSPEELARER